MHKQQFSESRATGEGSQIQKHHGFACIDSSDSFLRCRLLYFYWCNLSKPGYLGPVKLMAFFFLTTGWQPDVLSAGEGKKKKRKKEITKSKCKKSQSVSTIRFDGNVKYLLRSSKERKRTGVAT